MKTFLAIIGGLVLIAAASLVVLGWIPRHDTPSDTRVNSGGIEAGLKAFEHGDFAAAINELRPSATQGNEGAQYVLGMIYLSGRKQGVQDYGEAAKWLRAAANQGSARAQLCLGLMYGDGRGVEKDYDEGAKWLRLAADQGNAEAQYYLGVLFEYGRGVPEDATQAYMWLSLASTTKTTPLFEPYDAAEELAKVSNQMSPADISTAQEQARAWEPKKR